jgi:hypothetical protein
MISAARRKAVSGPEYGESRPYGPFERSGTLSYRLFKSLFFRRASGKRTSQGTYRVLENPKARESAAPDTDRPRNGQAGTGETKRETGRRNTKTDFSFAITENRSRKM